MSDLSFHSFLHSSTVLNASKFKLTSNKKLFTMHGEITEITDLKSLNIYLNERDNLENTVYISKVPQICKEQKCVLGIDEAGRGPVLGPMVYGIAFCPLPKSDILETLKCADSKALTEEKRDEIFTEICKNSDTMGFAVEVISPKNICNSMYSRSKISLNDVSMNSAIGLIRKAIAEGVNIASIYVDTVGPPEKYEKYLSSLFPDFLITVAKKADSTYPVVSAASICAKVTRDHALQVWNFENGLKSDEVKFGSGYPGDPVTKQFLKDQQDPVFGYPSLVRFSWSTSENMLDRDAYHVEWEDITEDKDKKVPVNNTTINSFFKTFQKSDKNSPAEKHKFFSERGLNTVTEF